ncbi:uncharacterized protein EHS24_002964 [Apiotrichum porosum]|uniref:C2H2-type domain-containing protein n=1 Tax=Apiotrichum porosum TaxID=105984 RepID=A0A427XGL1_9TREE|nr:uncharacterized protein EHS24_002964 [Apiotrichum porosum]RSH77893.1 hypothetical protein EHS24_002964 [Apiotrichum porosum]
MSLLPAFDESVHSSTATWVTSTVPKFIADDFAPYDFPNTTGNQPMDNDFEALFNIKFPSPILPETAIFDSGIPGISSAPQAALESALAAATGASTMACAPALTDKANNALQLDMFDITPAHSPLAGSSSYASPAFQFSPTPGLTACPTVDSTPAPRSNSRCSSRSSFSLQNDTDKPVADTIIGPDGKVKKLHLCPYEECARHTRTFRSNADLQRHIRSHRGERPYACPAPGCDKAYGQQNKMVNHVKQQHPALTSLVEIGRSRRRAPAAAAAAATAAAVASGASSTASTPSSSAASTPARAAAVRTVSSPATARSVSASSSRAAPYAVPSSHAALSGTSTGLDQPTPRRVAGSTAGMKRSISDVLSKKAPLW